MKTLTPLLRITFLVIFFLLNYQNVLAQLWDNYDGVDDLTYTAEDENYWIVKEGVLEASTGGSTSPDHSYASFDMTNKISSWSLSNENCNEWIGWMFLNRDVTGWGISNTSCCMVLAANNADLNENGCSGYAIGFKNASSPAPDYLTLFKFSDGLQGGTMALPTSSSEILETSYAYSESDGGVNFYIKLNPDGTWNVRWKAGIQLSGSDAIDPNEYTDGSLNSSIDETYRGSFYKYVGWVYAHATSDYIAQFDNLGFSQNGALPVELSSFTAARENGKTFLRWRTETEINNYGFDVERSYIRDKGGLVWQFLAFVNGYGNSNSPKEYIYIDNQCLSPGTYNYRIKQIDFDGACEYSGELPISVEESKYFSLNQNYPNPANPATTISFELPEDSHIKLTIYSILGERITTLIDGFCNIGKHEVVFDANNIPAGVYLYSLKSKNFMQVKKMTVLK